MLDYSLDGSVAVLVLDDGKANAYSHAALDAIGSGFDKAAADGAAAVVLAGRPGRFSAGFELSTMTASLDGMRALVGAGARLMMRTFTFPVPVVAACTGHALAAGALVLLSCDVRVGAEGDYKLGLNEVAIGMGLPHFAVELARYRMPPSAFDSIVLGRVFDPAAAVGAGFLDRTVALDDVVASAVEEATQLAALNSGAVAHTKRLARGPLAEEILARLDADLASIGGPSPSN